MFSWLPCQTGILETLDTERNDLMLAVPPDATESKEVSLLIWQS